MGAALGPLGLNVGPQLGLRVGASDSAVGTEGVAEKDNDGATDMEGRTLLPTVGTWVGLVGRSV